MTNTRERIGICPDYSFERYRELVEGVRAEFLNKYGPLLNTISVIDRDDVEQDLAVGYWSAYRRYKPNIGDLTSYTKKRMIGEALDQVRRLSIPTRNTVGSRKKIAEAWDKFVQEHKREPSTKELEELTRIGYKTIKRVLMPDQHIRLDAPVDQDTDQLTIEDKIGDDKLNPASIFLSGEEERSLRRVLLTSLNSLNDKERELIRWRYFKGLNFAQIGEAMDFSESRANQMHTLIIRKLKAKLAGCIND